MVLTSSGFHCSLKKKFDVLKDIDDNNLGLEIIKFPGYIVQRRKNTGPQCGADFKWIPL